MTKLEIKASMEKRLEETRRLEEKWLNDTNPMLANVSEQERFKNIHFLMGVTHGIYTMAVDLGIDVFD